MDRKSIELSFASLTILLTLITIIVFILFGSSILFYGIAVIAVIIAVINGWILSNVDNKEFRIPFLIEKVAAKKEYNKNRSKNKK